MGLPFYGRTWASERVNGDYIYSTIERIKGEREVTEIQRDNSIPYFTYEQTVTVTAYYEDDVSLSRRMELYRSLGVQSVGFWRLGQEMPEVWEYIRLVK
jgi:spore germination protein YaaH